MTTTVRILGSRAREQMPGTSITLLAPGFRGALTHLATGGETTGFFELPFAAASAGADVMLAAQISMHLEARPPEDGPELRSRSAVASHPRLIVPRRAGIAYALLQTDETGVSSFVLPAGRGDDEVLFPLTIAVQGATRRILRVLVWPERQVSGPGVLAVAGRWESLRRPYELAQLGACRQPQPPDWHLMRGGPVLLLLHDTFGTPLGTFADWIEDESFTVVSQRYGGRCLTFAHPTLAASLEENLGWLFTQLAQLPGPIDIVAHGRGGLLARVAAADGRLPLRRVCQVGTPNNGTRLAFEANLLKFLNGHIALLAREPAGVARTTLEGALCMVRFVAPGVIAKLPGVQALTPESEIVGAPQLDESSAQQWFTIGAQYAHRGGHCSESIDPDDFSATPNDLVVPADGCHEPGAPVTDSLRLGGSDVHHHNYFANRHVRERLKTWLS